MRFKSSFAVWVARTVCWVEKHLLHAGASAMPGRIALKIDPMLIAALAQKLKQGSIVVCGTNGKTTTNNLLCQMIQNSGCTVLCNRAGANMNSGVVTALLPGKEADWGVLEVDELSTPKVLPFLKPKYMVLLNIFRDQLDRCGEIDTVMQAIVTALEQSPETVLIYNADDPFCTSIASHVKRTIPFGIGEDLHLPQDRVTGGRFCLQCGALLEYAYHQYGQLGDFHCPKCGFGRAPLAFAATAITFENGISFNVGSDRIETRYRGVYMVYNLLAAFAAALTVGCSVGTIQKTIDQYHPQNGRLQEFQVQGQTVVLNLAKNPTGFNQNMALLLQDRGPKAVYFIINDNDNDGNDISWLWDVDFERLAEEQDLVVYAGGRRMNDLQVRLKYAGISAQLVQNVAQAASLAGAQPQAHKLYVLTNYSALFPAQRELRALSGQE
ncbi:MULTISPECIES: MurT ligase domain-containing protein [Caproicibacterium]|uniref:Lipid II isoglutaminyl synthase (glutamine-hydrolyzing) subunit MurT n=1 Tax=Caproicibacterium argilliputei TaxID=3030016 RepID=A0AA97DDS9_9FIRM|nr:MurT ligase domain-containing protein [Caproicibacterium argilliputei]WOC33576.1 MurT ligase domain-containing protein [Caproicibacterium argilliputei]